MHTFLIVLGVILYTLAGVGYIYEGFSKQFKGYSKSPGYIQVIVGILFALFVAIWVFFFFMGIMARLFRRMRR